MLAVLTILLAPYALTIPAGYYTLGELGAVISGQGENIRAAGDCADDVYVVRASNVSFEALVKALARDGRITVTSDGSTWTIRRSEPDRDAEKKTTRQYLDQIRGVLQKVNGTAARQSIDLLSQPPAVRDAAAKRLAANQKSDPWQAAIDRLTLQVGATQRAPFYELGIIDAVTRTPDPFGKAMISPLLQITSTLAPNGDLRSFEVLGMNLSQKTDAEIVRILGPMDLGAKLVLEPLSVTTVHRVDFYDRTKMPTSNGKVEIRPLFDITPSFYSAEPRAEAYWSSTEIAARDARMKETAALVQNSQLQSNHPLPSRPVRASEALLRSAEASGVNLVAYVSPMADLVLPGNTAKGLAGVVSDSNAGRLDQESLRLQIRERVGELQRHNLAAAMRRTARLTLSQADDVIVARNELRFLDALMVKGAAMPTAFDNLRLHDQLPRLDDLARHVAKMRTSTWGGSYFPATALDYCNPITFYPFAVALQQSSDLRKSIAKLSVDGTATVPLSSLGTSTEAAFRNALFACALFNDALVPGQLDPMVVRSFAGQPEAVFVLSITRTSDGYGFGLVHTSLTDWTSWVRNVRPIE